MPSTRLFHHWRYSEERPVLPGIAVVLLPVQSMLLSPLILWFLRRQLR